MRLIHYDVCSFLILTLMLISIFIRKLNNGHAQRLFVAFTVLIYVNTLADILCAAPYTLDESTDLVIRQVSTYVYFLLHASLMPLYIIFMGSVAGTWVAFLGKSKLKKFIFSAPYLLNLAAVAYIRNCGFLRIIYHLLYHQLQRHSGQGAAPGIFQPLPLHHACHNYTVSVSSTAGGNVCIHRGGADGADVCYQA